MTSPHSQTRGSVVRAEDRPGLAAPVHAATAVVGVTAALSILGATDIASAGDALRWLFTGARNRGLSVNATTIGWGKGTSQILTGAQLTALGPLLSPGDQLRYRIGTPLPRRPQAGSGRGDRLAERIPTMLWPEWSLRFAIPDCQQRQLRGALSMALLFVDTRLRLRDASDQLLSPVPEQSVLRVLRLLRQCGHWEHVRKALIRLADYLNTTATPIDYRRRRDLDYSGLLEPSQWRQICRDTSTHGGTAARARIARCYLYERLSGMPVSAAPFAHGDTEAHNNAADFPRRLTPELSSALLRTRKTSWSARASATNRSNGIHQQTSCTICGCRAWAQPQSISRSCTG